MKRFMMAAGLALSMCTAALSAADSITAKDDTHSDYDDCSWDNWDFDVYGEYLYWRLSRSDLDPVLGFYINPDYDSGFRAGLRGGKDQWDIGVCFTSYNTSKHLTLFDEDAGEELRHQVDFDYQVLDLEAGYTCDFQCGRGQFRPYFGVKIAWIEDRFRHITSGQLTDDELINFTGVGLYLGAETRYNLCECCVPIALVVSGDIAVLDGIFTQERFDSIPLWEEKLFVPAFDLFIGLEFDFGTVFCCTDFNLGIGYEVQSWQGWRRYGDVDELADFGLGGLVVKAGFAF